MKVFHVERRVGSRCFQGWCFYLALTLIAMFVFAVTGAPIAEKAMFVFFAFMAAFHVAFEIVQDLNEQ